MRHSYVHEELKNVMSAFRYDAHPMGMLISTITALSTFHPEANPALTTQEGMRRMLRAFPCSCDVAQHSFMLVLSVLLGMAMHVLLLTVASAHIVSCSCHVPCSFPCPSSLLPPVYNDERLRNKQIHRLIGTMPTIAAYAYRHRIGRPYVAPSGKTLTYAE